MGTMQPASFLFLLLHIDCLVNCRLNLAFGGCKPKDRRTNGGERANLAGGRPSDGHHEPALNFA